MIKNFEKMISVELKPETQKKEIETSPEILEAREFFIQQLKLLADLEKLKLMSTKELFDIYKDFINSKASKKHFEKLVKDCGGQKSKENYKNYLLTKLPQELSGRLRGRLRGRNSNAFIPQLEKIHQARAKRGLQMILGYHISDKDIALKDKINITNDKEIVHIDLKTHQEKVLSKGCCVEYSQNPQYLFNVPGNKLYLVEGSTADLKTHSDGLRARRVQKGEGLTIIAKFEITENLEKALDLKFR